MIVKIAKGTKIGTPNIPRSLQRFWNKLVKIKIAESRIKITPVRLPNSAVFNKG